MNHSYPRVLSSCLSDGPVLGLAVVRCPSRTERPLRGRTAKRLITPGHAIARIADARCSSRNRVDSTHDTPVGPESPESAAEEPLVVQVQLRWLLQRPVAKKRCMCSQNVRATGKRKRNLPSTQ